MEEKVHWMDWQMVPGTLPEEYRGCWLVVLCHGGAFDPVATTELLALAHHYEQLEKMGCRVLAVGPERRQVQLAWVYSIYDDTGIQLPFPVVQAPEESIARRLQLDGRRGVAILSPDGRLRAALAYPREAGCSVEELLRLLRALQHADAHRVLLPADWQEGTAAMLPEPENYSQLLERLDPSRNLCVMDWYLAFTDEGASQRECP